MNTKNLFFLATLLVLLFLIFKPKDHEPSPLVQTESQPPIIDVSAELAKSADVRVVDPGEQSMPFVPGRAIEMPQIKNQETKAKTKPLYDQWIESLPLKDSSGARYLLAPGNLDSLPSYKPPFVSTERDVVQLMKTRQPPSSSITSSVPDVGPPPPPKQ